MPILENANGMDKGHRQPGKGFGETFGADVVVSIYPVFHDKEFGLDGLGSASDPDAAMENLSHTALFYFNHLAAGILNGHLQSTSHSCRRHDPHQISRAFL